MLLTRSSAITKTARRHFVLLADPREGANPAMDEPLHVETKSRTPRKLLFHMPGNAVCILQMSPNRLIPGGLRPRLCCRSSQPFPGPSNWWEGYKPHPQTPPHSGLRLWPLNIFSGSSSGPLLRIFTARAMLALQALY